MFLFLNLLKITGSRAEATPEQLEFFEAQKIPIGRVFDATGLSKSEYYSVMKELDKSLAIGVTPCEKEGHTIRTRHGHCAQCNPAVIAFQERYSQLGFVYVASSNQLGFLKIGFSTDILDRIRTLNSFGYGGTNDWQWLHAFYLYDGGRIEYKCQLHFREYRIPSVYIRDGKEVSCLETFSCDHESVAYKIYELCEKKCHIYTNEEAITALNF